MKRVLLGFAAIAMMVAPAAGQTVRLDEGTFRILVDGREVGTETFSLRQNGTGADAVVIAQGRVVLDSRETTANVQLAGTGLRLVAYDVELSGADARRIRASISGSRASARTLSAAGETMKEYLVSDGAVLLDDGVAHHYYMIAQRAAAGATSTPILIPRESRQVQATITNAGEESVSAGGTTVTARRIVVQPEGGDARTVWVDGQGRVLRVEIPARNYVAVRAALP
ncbi:MAG TPA: hypothetical protein VK933_06590 [Longimicrobiales bacterium]|nr:hypothetical protein [Longimicrobiales bacterium]